MVTELFWRAKAQCALIWLSKDGVDRKIDSDAINGSFMAAGTAICCVLSQSTQDGGRSQYECLPAVPVATHRHFEFLYDNGTKFVVGEHELEKPSRAWHQTCRTSWQRRPPSNLLPPKRTTFQKSLGTGGMIREDTLRVILRMQTVLEPVLSTVLS